MGGVLGLLAFLLVVLFFFAVGLVVVLVATAGLFTIGHLVGGFFGVTTLGATAVAVVVMAGLGLVVWQIVKPEPGELSTADMVPFGSDEPKEPEYDEEGAARCPNCLQRLDVPRLRPQRRRP